MSPTATCNLRYVIGEIDSRELLSSPERHLRCNPTLSQFIVDEGFEPVVVKGPFAKQFLADDEVAHHDDRVTRGWRRLQEVRGLGIPINEYPLSDA